MSVGDLDRSIAFYTDVLTFKKISETHVEGPEIDRLLGLTSTRLRYARLRLGDEFIELNQFLSPKGKPMPPDSRSNDRWFQHIAIIVSDMDRAYATLEERMVRHASPLPQRLPDWNVNAGGIRAFYFRDPDGHFLEILQFPPDKGDPKWHRTTDRLFLGIDHTAIVVRDTEASLRFYRDTLGLKVVGESENFGKEQEHLNNVPGAHLRITTLRAAGGPGIELLQYLSPGDGRPYPPDARPNDQLWWQTALVVWDLNRVLNPMDTIGPADRHLSAVSNLERSDRSRAVRLIRDPDGHAMKVMETGPTPESAHTEGR